MEDDEDGPQVNRLVFKFGTVSGKRTRPNNHYTAKGSGAEEKDKICKLRYKPWLRQLCNYTL